MERDEVEFESAVEPSPMEALEGRMREELERRDAKRATRRERREVQQRAARPMFSTQVPEVERAAAGQISSLRHRRLNRGRSRARRTLSDRSRSPSSEGGDRADSIEGWHSASSHSSTGENEIEGMIRHKRKKILKLQRSIQIEQWSLN